MIFYTRYVFDDENRFIKYIFYKHIFIELYLNF